MPARLMRRSLGDPFVRLQLVTAAVILALYVLPVWPADTLRVFSRDWLCPVMLVWPLAGSWLQLGRLPAGERRSWRLIGVGVAAWMAALVVAIMRPVDAVFYVIYYLCLFLGLDGLANAESGRRRTTLERRLRLAGVLVFVVGWAGYVRLYAALPTTSVADSQISVAMGLAIVAQAGWRWRYGSTPRGRSMAGAFAVAALALLVSDVWNLAADLMRVTIPQATWRDIVWALPGLCLVVAVRSGHNADAPSPLSDAERDRVRTPIALGTALMFGGLSFPVVHGLLRMSAPGTVVAADDIVAFQALVIGASVTLSLLAAMAHWLLDRESDELRQQRSELVARLDEAQKFEALGRLAGGVAHDFNNLLTVIGGASELLEREPLSTVGQEMVRLNRTAVERAAGLTRQLLIFSRHNITQTVALNVDDAISRLGALMARMIGERVVIRTQLAASGLCTRINPAQFEQVITNLVVNARDAMPAGGLIMIDTAPHEAAGHDRRGLTPGRYVRVQVSDTGPGIPPDVRPHVFEPFFTTKTTDGSRGVGLATAHGIVTQCGGAFEVESAPGQGATFTFYLPVTAGETAPPAPPATGLTGRERVLLVEDDHDVRRLVSEMLRAKGYQVVDADSGEHALDVLSHATAPFDLLLTDVVMPGMNGVELADRVRAVAPAMRILFMSGYPDDALIEAGLSRNRADFMTKPITIDTLSAKVRAAMDGR